MPSFDKAAVRDVIDGLNLEETNRQFVEHWLSLWDGDALPSSSKFSPAKLKAYLPGIIKFEVVPDARVTVRLAGTGYRYVLQTDPTGKDWIEAAPEAHRANRLKIFSAVARGAILVAHRRVAMLDGSDFISEEVLVPFAPGADGAVIVLARVNFKANQFARIKSIAQVTGDPLDHKLVSFDRSLDR